MSYKKSKGLPKKKIVLFIVEGRSDKEAWEKIFQKLYQKTRTINFEVTRGDISSDKKINKDNVCDKLNEIVNSYLRDKKLIRNDLWQIIQIFDMNGAYIPNEAVQEGKTPGIFYSLTKASCKNCQKIRTRNQHKREIMDYLLCVDKIKSTPYEMYFVSCNLDHALYDEQNLDFDKKQDYADRFYEEFLGKESFLLIF